MSISKPWKPKAVDRFERRLVKEERRTRFQKLGRRRAQTQMRPISSSRVLLSSMNVSEGGRQGLSRVMGKLEMGTHAQSEALYPFQLTSLDEAI